MCRLISDRPNPFYTIIIVKHDLQPYGKRYEIIKNFHWHNSIKEANNINATVYIKKKEVSYGRINLWRNYMRL